MISNPIVVFYSNNVFHSQAPCVGEAKEFVDKYLEVNKVDGCEVFLYPRKDWVNMLLEAKSGDKLFLITKERIKLVKKKDRELLNEVQGVRLEI